MLRAADCHTDLFELSGTQSQVEIQRSKEC